MAYESPPYSEYTRFQSCAIHVHQANIIIGIVGPTLIAHQRRRPINRILIIESQPVIPAFVIQKPGFWCKSVVICSAAMLMRIVASPILQKAKNGVSTRDPDYC